MLKWKKKNNLDEFQEQKLLHIEKDSFWILYALLIGVIVVQMAMGGEPVDVAGELFSFLVISLVVVVRCIRNGLWDRRMKPDRRTNLLMSVIAGMATFLLTCLIIIRVHGGTVKTAVIYSMITAVCTLIVTYLVMSVLGKVYKKRLQQLEGKED